MKTLSSTFVLLLLAACGADSKVPEAGDTIIEGAVDEDGDGATAGVDCDDSDPMVHPGAAELCNERDDDCDGLVDEDGMDGTVFYRDSDGDGFGDATVEQMACAVPAGFVADSSDCDDGRADVNPEAVEDDCTDPVDYNCDGSVGYADIDGDGTPACNDCDDTNPAANPFAAEICNDGIDDDCDGEIDEAGAVGEQMWFADADGDLHGDPAMSMVACDQPAGYVENPTDCDDESASANPSGIEICDGLDNDCDGLVDGPDPVGGMTVYPDSDGDGHGSAGSPVEVCTPMAGFVESSDDCDDSEAAAHPGGTEVCDGIDNDCSGGVDEGLGSVYYADPDGDGYGMSVMTMEACELPDGYSAMDGDCDEADSAVYPGAVEVCDGIDNDCSGGVDEGLGTVYYADPDGDGYGMALVTMEACEVPDGYSAMDGDCDETDGGVYPGAAEVCDGIDNDCSGGIDEGLGTTFFLDTDGDGYGEVGETTEACDVPTGYASLAGDCDVSDSSINPGAAEVCDGVDNDCDSLTDDEDDSVEVALGSFWYADEDGDGYGGDTESISACEGPDGYVASADDCDDADPMSYPGASEIWYDGIDQDCEGDGDSDADGDGHDAIEVGGDDADDTDPDCWTGCTEGLTYDDPADSCEAIYEDNPDAPNGWYWIDPEGPPMEVFCDIENGGWMQCFEMVNTSGIDLGTENTWLDDCIDFSNASWTSNEVRVTLTDESGSELYDETGSRLHDWSYDQITSTIDSGSQFYSDHHERLVTLSNGDKLMMAGRNSSNSGCGGSFGNGYSVVIYPESPDYHSNVKMLVVPYYHADGGSRGFSEWSQSHEISYAPGTMGTCSYTVAQLGTFGFWLR